MKSKFLLPAMFMNTVLLVACGGGSGDDTDAMPSGDASMQMGDEFNEATKLDPSLQPLLSIDGAEAGLRGCINRGLYINGPHTVMYSQRHSSIKPYWETTFNDSLMVEEQYNVIDVNEDGVSQVDVTRITTRSTTGTTITDAIPYTIEGYQRRIVGASRETPYPNAYIEHFDLNEGESIPQTINTSTAAAPRIATRVDTYIGREEITIAGRVVKACRVDTVISQDGDLPQFRLLAMISKWFGIGTGLELRKETTTYPDSEQDTIIATTVLTTAVINGEKIH